MRPSPFTEDQCCGVLTENAVQEGREGKVAFQFAGTNKPFEHKAQGCFFMVPVEPGAVLNLGHGHSVQKWPRGAGKHLHVAHNSWLTGPQGSPVPPAPPALTTITMADLLRIQCP